jgi:hypothetical protein
MKRYFMISFILFISSVQIITANEFTRKLVRVNLSDVNKKTMIDLLELGLDIISYRAMENTLEFIIHTNMDIVMTGFMENRRRKIKFMPSHQRSEPRSTLTQVSL